LPWYSTNGHLEEHGKITLLLEVLTNERTEEEELHPRV
jgi:hypothetical protein